MTAPIRVLIIDDDALVRSGLTMMLSGAPQIEVVGEADDGRGVLPDVDLHHPGRRPDGHQDAAARRDRRHPAAEHTAPPARGARAHHLRR